MQGDIEWAIMTLGMQHLQKCCISPFIIRDFNQGHFLETFDSILSSQDFQSNFGQKQPQSPTEIPVSIIQGQNVIVGVRLAPPAGWKEGFDKFAEPFERFYSNIQFHYQLKGVDGVSLPREVSSLQLTAPALLLPQSGTPRDQHDEEQLSMKKMAFMRKSPQRGELFFFTQTTFQIARHHLDKPLILLLTLSITLQSESSTNPTSSSSQSPSTGSSTVKQDYGASSLDEEDNRKLLETYRFRPHKIPSRDSQLQLVLSEPMNVTTSSCELQGANACVWSITVHNKHDRVAVTLLSLDVHLDITTKENNAMVNVDATEQGDRESIDSFNSEDSNNDLDTVLNVAEANRWFDVSCHHDEAQSLPAVVPPGGSFTIAYTVHTKDAIYNQRLSSLQQVGGRFSTPVTLWWQLGGTQTEKYTLPPAKPSSSSSSSSGALQQQQQQQQHRITDQVSSNYRVAWSIGLKTLQRLLEVQHLRLSEPRSLNLESLQREYMLSEVVISAKGPLFASLNAPFVVVLLISNRSPKAIRQLCVTRREFFRGFYDVEAVIPISSDNGSTTADANATLMLGDITGADGGIEITATSKNRTTPYAILNESGPIW